MKYNTTNFDWNRYLIGAEKLLNAMEDQAQWVAANARQHTYPPCNVIKLDDNNYMVELAVAGFTQDRLEIVVEPNRLTLIGKPAPKSSAQYLYEGIAARGFECKYALAENMVVKGAKLINGMLKIEIEHELPEAKKPRKVEIEV